MKTSKHPFTETYHHIDAPTFSDSEKSKEVGRRILIDPKTYCGGSKKIWREPELEYLSKNKWFYKRKLDGENMRVKWDGERAVWNGKSNDYVCKDETVEYMNKTFAEEIFEENFGRAKIVLLFGERMGPKCQGNELNLGQEGFILYDVKIDTVWLEPKNIIKIAEYFGIHTCYDYMLEKDEYADTLENLIHKTANGKFKKWEGIVASPAAGVFNRKGERIITKIKNEEYLP